MTELEPWYGGKIPGPLVTLSSAQSAIAERDARIAELERERDDKAACLQEVIRHAKAEGNRYCEDEFGAPYIVNARAEAAEALLKEAGPAIEKAMAILRDLEGKLPHALGMAVGDAIDQLRFPVSAARSLMSKIGERNGE